MKYILFLTLVLSACGTSNTGIKVKMEPIYAVASYLSIDRLQHASQNSAVDYNNTSNPRIVIEYATDEALTHQYGRPVLGLATVFGNHYCRIQISDRTFQFGQDWLDSVLWHEIGHCLGMEHEETDASDLMYPYAKPFSMYTPNAINTFLRRLYEKTR